MKTISVESERVDRVCVLSGGGEELSSAMVGTESRKGNLVPVRVGGGPQVRTENIHAADNFKL